MYRGTLGQLTQKVKIYVNGEFWVKTDCPESIIDLELDGNTEVDWSELEQGRVYVTLTDSDTEE